MTTQKAIPQQVYKIVVAVIADEPRRNRMMTKVEPEVMDNYVKLNRMTEIALSEIPTWMRDGMKRDIAKKCGYGRSCMHNQVAKNQYYEYKATVLTSMAILLRLI